MITMRLFCIAACLQLTACTSFRPVEWPWSGETIKATGEAGKTGTNLICPDSSCKPEDARRALVAASNYCSRVIVKHDDSRTLFGSSKLLVGTLGAISGGVIAQFAQGTAAQAWSGVSGVANGMQTQMDQAFAGVIDTQRRGAIAKAALDGAKSVSDAEGDDDKVYQAIRMALACSMGAASTDADLMIKLTGGNPLSGSADPSVENNPAAATTTPTSTAASAVEFKGNVLTLRYTYPDAITQANLGDVPQRDANTFCKRVPGNTHAKAKGTPSMQCPSVNAECHVSPQFTCAK